MKFGDRISPNEQFIILAQCFVRLVSFDLVSTLSLLQVQTFLFLSSTGFASRTDKERSESYRDSRFIGALSARPSTHDFIITGLINAGRSAGDRHVGFAYPIREGIRQNQEIRVELPRYFKRFRVRGI